MLIWCNLLKTKLTPLSSERGLSCGGPNSATVEVIMGEKRVQKLRKADSQILHLRLVIIDQELSLRSLTEEDRRRLVEEQAAIHRELRRRDVN